MENQLEKRESGQAKLGRRTLAGPREPRHPWRRETLLLLALAVVITVLFAFSPLDIDAARVFYRSNAVDHWPLARRMPWSLLYGAAPWITASLVLIGLVALAAGILRDRRTWRLHAVFLLLSVVVGPGLLINTVFKDHWSRPRPREIVAFGGPLQYVPAPLPGREAGASFPCGHCSVGFLYGAGWWIWKRRRPAWARTSLAIGILAGVALGAGRMAAGGHFASDVVWSALLAYGVCHILYYHVLSIHRRESPESPAPVTQRAQSHWHHMTVLLAALGAAGVLVALFATPHGTQINTVIPLSSLPRAPQVFEFAARTMDVEIVLIDPPASQFSVAGELHGFGLPTSRLNAFVDFKPDPLPTLYYRVEQTGWFTDLNGAATVLVPAAGLARLVVRLDHGNIRVRDMTRSGVVRSGILHLDLKTASGHVQAREPVTSISNVPAAGSQERGISGPR